MENDQSAELGVTMPDRSAEAAPLTTERRYGFSRIGCAAAFVLIILAVGTGVALVIGVRDAGIMLAILLPILVLSAGLANVFLWWQHKKAVRRRELAANEWVSTPQAVQQVQASAPSETPRSSGSWFGRISLRASSHSTPPPGYQTVVSGT
ncbi:uncharacterized protein LOC124407654 [Diprion similis]|uniref:uncharacterized protein LOC124407654 n=1 Tax=Diprion similis TaxID=362088 RepID=UPI001EF7E447|nr:uncharacterized protein LOC124407654 [Diprion similis]